MDVDECYAPESPASRLPQACGAAMLRGLAPALKANTSACAVGCGASARRQGVHSHMKICSCTFRNAHGRWPSGCAARLEVHVVRFAVWRISSAARAALREALALGSSVPMRSCAARAALRGASPLPHLLQRAMACEAIVASLVGTTRFFGWRGRRPTCLQPCAKANNHGLTGTARCNKCGSGLAPRSAARAALDLKGTEDLKASAPRSAARAALDLKGAKDPKASASRCAARAARSQGKPLSASQDLSRCAKAIDLY